MARSTSSYGLIAIYNASAPTITDGHSASLQVDQNGYLLTRETRAPGYEDNTNNVAGTLQKPVASSTYSPSAYDNAAAATKANIKATAGAVFSIRVTNDNAAARYFQLHNKATAPAATEVPQRWWKIPAGSAAAPGVLQLDSTHFAPSEYFSTGIGFAVSTTTTTFTDSATASEHNIHVRYV